LARHSKDGSFGASDSLRVGEGGRRRLSCPMEGEGRCVGPAKIAARWMRTWRRR
jgi:hypothetical protein